MANITGSFLQQDFNPADWTYYGRTYIPLAGEGTSWSDPVYKNNKTGETMTPAQYAASGEAPKVTDYNSLVKYAQWYEGQKGKTISPDKLNEFSLLSPDVQAAMIANPELAVKSMEATANLANNDWLSIGAEGGLNSASAWKWGPNGLYYDNSAYNQINGNGWDERFASFVDDNATNIGLALMGGSMAAGLSGASGAAGSGAAADGVTVGSAAGGNAAGAGITSSELGALGTGGAATGASAVGSGGGFSAGNMGTAATAANTLNSAGGQGMNTSTNSGSFVDPTTGLTYNSDGTGSGAYSGNYSGLLSSLFGGSNGAAILGGLLGSQNGAQESGVTTTKQVPWDAQQPYLLDMFNRAQAMSNTSPNTALTNQAQGTISNFLSSNPTQGYGMNLSNPYSGQTTAAATNPYLGMDNPYLTAAIDNANNDVIRSYMPAMIAANHSSGSYGNSGVADIYSKNLADALSRNATSMRASDYTNQQNLTQSLNQFNANLAQNDITRNANLWGTDQSRDQQAYQYNNSAQLTAAQNAPTWSAQQYQNQWAPITNYQNAVTGTYGASKSEPYYTNPYTNILGGITTGLSLYNQYNKSNNGGQ